MASSPESDSSEIDLYDSDGYYEDGVREMNREETNQYYQAIQQSDGFDVPTFPKTYAIGLIVPISEHLFTPELQVCAEEAIKHYNIENGTNFEFVKIVKANQRAARGILYFITFEVCQIGTPQQFPTTTFEARVLAGLENIIDVQLCRPKSSG